MGMPPDLVEKIMSLDLREFHRTLKTLAPDVPLKEGQTQFAVPEANADVQIIYKPLDGATLGGLLNLPRARITLHLGALDTAQRQTFLARFDRAFQRGGG